MARTFDEWFGKFRGSISDYKYYVDFDGVYKNVSAIRVELNILNSLVGAASIKEDFVRLIKRYPEVLRCIPILIAKRESEIVATDVRGWRNYSFDTMNYSIDDYVYFMGETGLFELLQHRIVSNLVDYVTGVETGLNTHGRKNRGGHLMENLVEQYIREAGYIKGETYFKEMESSVVKQRWGIDLSALLNAGKTVKRFDFVIKTATTVYAIETNFYNGGGSKLNETARSYKTLTIEARGIEGFVFMWITDGLGWLSARHNLEETFDVLLTLYNIDDLEQGILKHLS